MLDSVQGSLGFIAKSLFIREGNRKMLHQTLFCGYFPLDFSPQKFYTLCQANFRLFQPPPPPHG